MSLRCPTCKFACDQPLLMIPTWQGFALGTPWSGPCQTGAQPDGGPAPLPREAVDVRYVVQGRSGHR